MLGASTPSMLQPDKAESSPQPRIEQLQPAERATRDREVRVHEQAPG
ncbi:hypothetical protein P8H27_18200 [Pseudomonas sp. sp1636]|nr:hypothetical protein [Pseudomonas sp. sp1636]MDM8350813.1 hypothetical protein [Pseudomonas sp. sp1636]